jgi:hypothetical protein
VTSSRRTFGCAWSDRRDVLSPAVKKREAAAFHSDNAWFPSVYASGISGRRTRLEDFFRIFGLLLQKHTADAIICSRFTQRAALLGKHSTSSCWRFNINCSGWFQILPCCWHIRFAVLATQTKTAFAGTCPPCYHRTPAHQSTSASFMLQAYPLRLARGRLATLSFTGRPPYISFGCVPT